MSKTVIASQKRIEVFGPNKPKVKLDKDKKFQSVKQEWQGNKKNRLQIIVGQQEIPTECLEWGMVKAMIDAEIITVGKTTANKKPAAKKKVAAKKVKVEAEAAKDLAGDGLPKTEGK